MRELCFVHLVKLGRNWGLFGRTSLENYLVPLKPAKWDASYNFCEKTAPTAFSEWPEFTPNGGETMIANSHFSS